jgi:DNA-binding HxlR family transcriptional regulator
VTAASFSSAGPIIDVLSRRGSMDTLVVLAGGSLAERALVSRLPSYNPSVVTQRVSDLRALGVVEVVPESGDLRLSAHGRRLQGVLDRLADWAQTSSR